MESNVRVDFNEMLSEILSEMLNRKIDFEIRSGCLQLMNRRCGGLWEKN